jgi:ABC-2 type transport system permease protein
VTSPSKDLSAQIKTVFDEYNLAHPLGSITLDVVDAGAGAVEEQAKQDLRKGYLDAYAALEGNLEGEEGTIRLFTHKSKPSLVDALGTVERLLREAVIDRRYETRGLDRKMLEAISNVPIQWAELGDTQDQERTQGKSQQMARMMVPFAFMYLIFMGIVGMGQHMISSIIEEMNSRIIEVLLSAISPFELMAGKIVGLAA